MWMFPGGCSPPCTQKYMLWTYEINWGRLRTCLFATCHWRVGSVASDAVFRRRLVEEYFLFSNFLEQFVTLGALYVLVCPPQREGSPLVVVEQRGLPFHAVVAVGTWGGFALGELLSVNVCVAVLAGHRGSLEIH